MCKGLGNVHDSGLACFDENEVIVGGAIGFGQLSEHLINEIVEKDLGGLVKFGTKWYCMITVQFCQASYSKWISSCSKKFVDFDVIFVKL